MASYNLMLFCILLASFTLSCLLACKSLCLFLAVWWSCPLSHGPIYPWQCCNRQHPWSAERTLSQPVQSGRCSDDRGVACWMVMTVAGDCYVVFVCSSYHGYMYCKVLVEIDEWEEDERGWVDGWIHGWIDGRMAGWVLVMHSGCTYKLLVLIYRYLYWYVTRLHKAMKVSRIRP